MLEERFGAAYTDALDSLHERGARATLEAIVAARGAPVDS